MLLVLVIDDHQDTREVVIRVLKSDGYHPLGFNCLLKALEFLKTHVPSLIILDYSMPNMDGLSFLRILRLDIRYRRLPVLMFSAFDGRERQFALDAGVDGYVVKGVGAWSGLQQEIERLIKRG